MKLEVLVSEYRSIIQEAVTENEIELKTRSDIGKLNAKLKVIYKAASYDGIDETIIGQLIEEAIPKNNRTRVY